MAITALDAPFDAEEYVRQQSLRMSAEEIRIMEEFMAAQHEPDCPAGEYIPEADAECICEVGR